MAKQTRARKAVDRAAIACDKAYDALRELNQLIPDSVADRHLSWVKELGEYADYLERCTWPDKQGEHE